MPIVVEPPRRKEFDQLIREGWTVKYACQKIGVSETWGYRRIKAIASGSTSNSVAEKQNERWGEPIPINKLSPEASRAREDFGYFRRRYFGRIASPWQEEAAEAIVKLLASDQKEYTVINCPPGSGKSTMDIPAWLITRNRGIRMIIGSKTASQAEAYVGRLRRMLERTFPVQADEEEVAKGRAYDAEATLAADYGSFRPTNPEIWRQNSFIVAQPGNAPIDEKEPTVAGFGMDSGSLGWRVNYIVWDDVVDNKVLKTEDGIQAQRDWWDDEAERRLEPDGLLVLQGQRLGANDLYRYCLDKLAGTNDDEDVETAEHQYSHIVYRAHYEDLCTGYHKHDLLPYPDSCLLDPVRLSWRSFSAHQRNRAKKFQVVFQQEDIDPASVLVQRTWINGGRDPDGFEAPGCLDRDRGLWEVPKGLAGQLIGIATADPSPTKYWGIEMWAYHPASEQRFLLNLIREPMEAPKFLDWNYNQEQFTGVMEDWRIDAQAAGVPIKYWIVEKNAAQRFMLQYDHFHRWMRKTGITVISHETTHKNKSDGDYGVQTIAPHYQHGRVRLPYKDGGSIARSNELIAEVTRYPEGASDDLVMAHWFFEWTLPRLVRANNGVVYKIGTPIVVRAEDSVDGSERVRDLDTIVNLYRERKSAQGPMLSRMAEIRDAYNGEIVLPMPELTRVEKPSVANLLALGIDQNARRVASTLPNVTFPPPKPTKLASRTASKKRSATFGWFEHNRMAMKLYRRARWLIAYVSAPVVVRPDPDGDCPLWQLRDPLTAYPAPSLDPDDICPPDCIFTYIRSYQWLERNYPGAAANMGAKPSDRVEIIEYLDDEMIGLAALATRPNAAAPAWGGADDGAKTQPKWLVPPMPNRADRPLAIVPGRITLDRPQGQFDNIIGMYQTQARAMALELIAVERSVFPEQWFVHEPNAPNAQIITLADAKQGVIGELEGGKMIYERPDPSALNLQVIDRQERNQRVTAGIPPEYGGESATNVRTGRRGDAIMSATVDFPIQELQVILAESLQEEVKAAIAVELAYSPKAKSFYVNWPGAKGQVDYTPADLWVSDENYVSYSHAGADQNNLVVALGERIGAGLMSKKTGMGVDPMIDDPDTEHDQIIAEGLEQALMSGVQQQAAQGAIPPHFIARLITLVRTGKDFANAVDQVQKEAQAQQATQAPAGAPETQPGIAQPGAGAEASVAPGPAGLDNFAQLMQQLHPGNAPPPNAGQRQPAIPAR